MRKLFALAIVLGLAACSGGGGGSTTITGPLPTAAPTTAPQGNLVTPQFTIVITQPGSSSARSPMFVSTATASVTITLTSVNGSSVGLPSPTSVTTNITGSACPCTVNGPASPAGQSDAFSITTFDTAGGTGNALDTGGVTYTPTEGAPNPQTVTLNGIPYTVAITGVPTTWAANTSGQTASLTVTVKDHSGQTITGTYANVVRITDPDAETTNGTHLTGTNAGTGCTNSCVDMTASTDTITLNYGGLAENPVILASSGTALGTAGTATFTPLLNAITGDAGNSTTSLGGTGIDLFTSLNTSPTGYSGSVKYGELGFTNGPYSKQLAVTGAANCSTFATLATGANTGGETPFTATATATPSAGSCTLTVTDNLTDQTNSLPTFKVTYTTGQVNVNSVNRR
jgi:hypothetical protein